MFSNEKGGKTDKNGRNKTDSWFQWNDTKIGRENIKRREMFFNLWKHGKRNIKDIAPISKKLRTDNRSSEEFEIMVSNLTFEELIELKLEVSTRMMVDGKFYGFPIYEAIPEITRFACVKFAIRSSLTKRDGACLLGINFQKFCNALKYFKLDFATGETTGDGGTEGET